jgi:hypothetical protein
MTAERIALISDCEGNVAALEAALRAMKQHAPDAIVVAGDILASPFSPAAGSTAWLNRTVLRSSPRPTLRCRLLARTRGRWLSNVADYSD